MAHLLHEHLEERALAVASATERAVEWYSDSSPTLVGRALRGSRSALKQRIEEAVGRRESRWRWDPSPELREEVERAWRRAVAFYRVHVGRGAQELEALAGLRSALSDLQDTALSSVRPIWWRQRMDGQWISPEWAPVRPSAIQPDRRVGGWFVIRMPWEVKGEAGPDSFHEEPFDPGDRRWLIVQQVGNLAEFSAEAEPVGTVVRPPDLPLLLTYIANDLDERAYPFAGAIRQAARRIQDLEHHAAGTDRVDGGCLLCGLALVQPARAGRRRKFCSDRHRRQFAELGRSLVEVMA